MLLRIVSKPGSKARKEITSGTGIQRYRGNKYGKVSAIVNYGLAGKKLADFFKRYPSATKMPMMNKRIGCPKFKAVMDAADKGLPVPETRLTLTRADKPSDWLVKRQYSIGGKGIKIADKGGRLKGCYYQKFVSDRRYELRVHAFNWTDCTVQKRLGNNDVVAWNYKNGGHFQSVRQPERYRVFREAIEVSLEILKLRSMAFGAVDFIVDTDGKIYFIEVNASPGFTDFSRHIYVDAFNSLKDLPKAQLLRLCE